MYKGEEINLAGVEPAWDRVLVKVAKSDAETASGIVVAPTSGGSERPSEGEVRQSPCLWPRLRERIQSKAHCFTRLWRFRSR